MPIKFTPWYTSEQIAADEGKAYYVFGDNAERRGFGGQAKEARGQINSIGVVTKLKPEHGYAACYMHDDQFMNNVAIINADMAIVERRLKEGFPVYWPEAHIGTDRARLKDYAPFTLEYINLSLRVLCAKYGFEGKPPEILGYSLPGEGARLLTENEAGSSPAIPAISDLPMTQAEYDAYPIEDRLCFAARMSSAPYQDCKLMDEASDEIIRLKKKNAELQRFVEKYSGDEE